MTAKELIRQLQLVSPDSSIIIEDADTGWYLKLSQVRVEVNEIFTRVILYASYRDEVEKENV